MEENKIEKGKNKKHGPLYWVFVVVGVTFIIYTSIGIGEKVVKIKEPNVSTKNDNVEEKTEEVKEQDVNTTTENKNEETTKQETTTTTQTLTEEQKKTVATKLAMLAGDSDYKYGETIRTSGLLRDAFDTIMENRNDNNVRMSYIMQNVKSKTISTKDYSKYKFNDPNMNVKDYEQLDVKSYADFAKAYKYVYGVVPQSIDINGCPGYYYEQNSKTYFIISECGGGIWSSHYIYIDDIQKHDEQNIYISAYVGGYSGYVGESKTAHYYADYIHSEEKDNKLTKEFKTITAENKTSFTKYNFVFEKANDGEYYFKNVVKAK